MSGESLRDKPQIPRVRSREKDSLKGRKYFKHYRFNPKKVGLRRRKSSLTGKERAKSSVRPARDQRDKPACVRRDGHYWMQRKSIFSTTQGRIKG